MIPFLQKIHKHLPGFGRMYFYFTIALTFSVFSFQEALSQDAARNRKPKITGQSALSMNEGGSITIALEDLIVEDKDDWFYPFGFTLNVYSGDNYTVSGHTVTPATDFSGTLTIKVTVHDGEDESDVFDLKVTVNGSNDPPTITGQQIISTNEDEPFTLQSSHLTISDPDDTEFTITLSAGSDYSVSGQTITPVQDFSGTLSIPVTVNDGEYTSNSYTVALTVNNVNDSPRITGQQALTAAAGAPIAIELADLTVEDSDNDYPADFSLTVLSGANYSLTGNQITANVEFSGDLVVGVKVNDGTNDSEKFNLIIAVVNGNDGPIITNQTAIIINEDEYFTLDFSHLKVTDPDNNYPEGFTMQIGMGENYSVQNKTIIPLPDYSGNIFVPVTVNDGEVTSDPFSFQITVRPINDAPEIELNDADTLYIKPGGQTVALFQNVSISDVDNDSLTLAEVGFTEDQYQPGSDILLFTNTNEIKGVFDSQDGILALIGKASVDQYIQALKSIQVQLAQNNSEAYSTQTTKGIYISVNDGQANSNRVEKKLAITEKEYASLDIPTGFTPNGDAVNDTWSIRSVQGQEYLEALVRVYTKSGQLVFEATGLQAEWDGRYNGVALPADVYFYTIDLNIPEEKPSLKGIVTILR